MAQSSWPPPEGLCTPTVARDDVILSVSGSVVIDAPASLVFEVLRDTTKYGVWNTFAPRVDINSQPDGLDSPILGLGTSMTFHAVMDPKKPTNFAPTQLRVVDVSTPDSPSDYVSRQLIADPTFTSDLSKIYRIAWKVEGSFMTRGLRSERFHEIIILEPNKCEVRSWETMGGILARAVKWTYGSALPLRFREWNQGLKIRSEDLAPVKNPSALSSSLPG